MKKTQKKILISFCFVIAGLSHSYGQFSNNSYTTKKLKTSLNAYSFNVPLSKGVMDVFDLMKYAAALGFDGVDITAYYFEGYPNVPSDEYLYKVKQKAFLSGLDISGTGVRTNFTSPNIEIRKQSVQLVKSWITASEKMGIPVIRIFAGEPLVEGYTLDEVTNYMVEDIKECVAYGQQHGVVVAIQNHWDFIKTATQVIDIMKRVDSQWFGLILDVGSFKSGDPYAQIEEAIPYAVSWQLKENLYVNGIETKTDLSRIIQLIKVSNYKGYIPIETLGTGDPELKVEQFQKEVNEALKLILNKKL